jgi:hypothetical protein
VAKLSQESAEDGQEADAQVRSDALQPQGMDRTWAARGTAGPPPPEDLKNQRNWTEGKLERRCFVCLGKEDLRRHHLDLDDQNHAVTNLLTLCRGCQVIAEKCRFDCLPELRMLMWLRRGW